MTQILTNSATNEHPAVDVAYRPACLLLIGVPKEIHLLASESETVVVPNSAAKPLLPKGAVQQPVHAFTPLCHTFFLHL